MHARGGRVRGLVAGPSLEVRLQSDDGTREQSSGSGLTVGSDSGLASGGPHETCGLATQWALGPHDASGSSLSTALPCESGLTHFGLPPDVGRASKKLLGGVGLGIRGPDSPLICNVDEAHVRGARSFNGTGPSSERGLDQP